MSEGTASRLGGRTVSGCDGAGIRLWDRGGDGEGTKGWGGNREGTGRG